MPYDPRHEKTCSLLMQKQRRRSAAQLISAFVFATWIINPSTSYYSKFQTSYHLPYSPIVSNLMGNGEDRFSRDAAHVI